MRTLTWCALLLLALLAQAGERLPVREVLIGNRFFKLEVAHTPETRAQGMMDREGLEDGTGMLFVFPLERELSFWMCRCLIDLEIVYLDANGVVVDIQTMAAEKLRKRSETQAEYEERLPHYKSKAPAQFAIELSVGSVEDVELKKGDRIIFDLPVLNRLVEGQPRE
ncbi:MAG: DUF192 domain-containing protein [Victivallales bacterium]|jgi:uncharacterized protein|nr:DUF192 domain-containing protein [Victivallales bacterium]MBT7299656.1 DUF192 domain-containing protein [Victivallales bacterium]